MNKDFQKLQKRVSQVETEIKTEEARLSETEAALEKSTGEIGEAKASLQVFLHAKNTVEVDSCEKKLAELKKGRDRAELLIPALKKKIDQLKIDLARAQQSLDEKFSELARKWLSEEVKNYNTAANILISRLRKLFACSKLLREKDFTRVYREALGPGWEVLTNLKIAILREDFSMAEFNQPGRLLTFSKDDSDQVYQDIIKYK